MTSELGWRFEAASSPPRLIPSVRARSALAAVIVVALALAGGAAVLYFVLQRSLLSDLNAAASVRAAEVANQLQNYGDDWTDSRLKADPHEGQLVQVVDPHGNVVASSSDRPNQQPISGLVPAPGQQLREKTGLFTIVSSQRPFLVLTRGVQVGDVGNFTVVIGSSTDGQRESVKAVLRLLLIGFPGLLLLVGTAIWVLIGRALNPVEQIRRRVAGIGAAQLDGARVPVPPTRDEIAMLAITMNQMLDRLQAAQQAQRQFVADASHELRSPLATLTASLEVADADGTGRAWRDLRSVMASEAARMATLVENLLLLARADDQGLTISAVDVDLDDLMEQEAHRLRSSAVPTGSPDLRVTTSIEPARVLGDRLKLSQLLRNLVDNASRYAHSSVRLELAVIGSAAVITVDDDGPGIPEADRLRVFERFVRLDGSRDRASGGAGLGLPIVREVVRGHHGQVAVGTSPAGGCRVVVHLPIQQFAPLTLEAAALEAAALEAAEEPPDAVTEPAHPMEQPTDTALKPAAADENQPQPTPRQD